ncbi:MAG TPA: hypothetical protein VFR23_06845 [Jiangellaceae bacterium]|nr:hypothetical protein [Jiangellaceae bacterium]
MPLPPPNVPPLEPARQAAMRELIEFAVANEKHRSARVRVPIAAGLGAAVALAGGTAAAIVLTREPVTDSSLVHCLARAELDAQGNYPGTAVAATASQGGPVSVEDARAACEEAWRQGILDPSAEIGAPLPDPDPARRAAVPAELSVCVMPDGSAAVVPGAAACGELDLPLRLEQP